MKLFIVEGRCGEHDDRSNWMVKACLSAESAEKLKVACDEFAASKGVGSNRLDPEYRIFTDVYCELISTPEAERATWPDPHLHSDYTGTYYVVKPIEVHAPDRDTLDIFFDALIGLRENLK